MIPKSNLAGKLKIVVLAGGISHEREISLKSGRRVADALIEKGAQVVMREPDHDLLANLKTGKPDVIWPVLHGASGEDGALREILALTGIPFVGATGSSAKLAWDKSVAKILVTRNGVQAPGSITLPSETFKELDAASVLKLVSKSMALPVVVKPARSGSAQGVTIVKKTNSSTRP
jgi:D-alanine-D-alanine ligase